RQQARELAATLAGHSDRHALALRYARFSVDSAFSERGENAIWPQHIPVVLLLLGEPGLALDYLERLAASPRGADVVIMLPAVDPMGCDPRFVAVVQKMKTRDPHFDRVCSGKH